MEINIAIIGCGNMGLAFCRSFIQNQVVDSEHLFLIEQSENRRKELQEMHLGIVLETLDQANTEEIDYIVLAIKPQDFLGTAQNIRKNINKKGVILSIMAGITIGEIKHQLNCQNVVRIMPNTPVLIGKGMTGYTVSENVSNRQLAQIERLLDTTGSVVYLHDEKLMNAVTAVSGSGPAYFFYIAKHMIEAAKQMGIDEIKAHTLVKQTMLGAYYMMQSTKEPIETLIDAVCSKGGTTEAALQSFEKNKLGEHIIQGIKVAQKKGEKLSGNK